MSYEAAVGKLLAKALDSIFGRARMTANRRRAVEAISAAMQELVSREPDLDSAESLVAEARDLLPTPTAHLLRAETMLGNAQDWEGKTRRRRVGKRRALRKKAARKKARRKKAARKKAGRKKAARKKAGRKKAARKKAGRKKAARKKVRR